MFTAAYPKIFIFLNLFFLWNLSSDSSRIIKFKIIFSAFFKPKYKFSLHFKLIIFSGKKLNDRKGYLSDKCKVLYLNFLDHFSIWGRYQFGIDGFYFEKEYFFFKILIVYLWMFLRTFFLN